MQRYFIIIFVILLIIGCNSKKVGSEQKIEESHKNEEKSDPSLVPEQETEAEKATEQENVNLEDNLIEDEATLWSSYRSAKAAVKEAESDNDFEKQAQYLLEAAEYANALQRFEIEAWQYNNAGFVLIEGFKDKTDYINVMTKLNNLKLKSEITQYRKEARMILNNEKELLLQASGYLSQAKEIDDNLENSSRTTTITSNITFVNDVLRFLNADEIE